MKFEADIGCWERGVVRGFEAKGLEEAEEKAFDLVVKVWEEREKGLNDLPIIDLVQIRPVGHDGPVWDYMNGWLGVWKD
jgi:hypothetical protein